MPRLCHAILYDADEKGRETLAYGFEIDGLKITACSRVDEFERALTSTPAEAVVVVLRDEDEHAIPLLRGLAESPQHGQRPRLVLAEAPTLPASVVEMNLPGPSGFLPLPAFVRDVVTAAKLLAGGATRDEESSLEGALSDFGLFFILRTMVALGLSGVVEVDESNRKGELRFHEGEVVSAQVGPHDGLAALHQLLLWEEAALVIRFRATVRRGQEFPKGDELLDDCARFLRDFEHATRSIGHAQSLFVQDAEKTASLLDEVTAELVPILRLFDGHRNLGDVLEDSPYRAFDTLRTVARLIELKTIRRKAIEKPTTGLAPGKRPRPAQEDWLGRSGEAAAMGAGGPGSNVGDVRNVGSAGDFGPSAPRPARVEARSTPAGGAPVAGMRGHRSFRRKTGEHAIAPAPTPDQPAGTPGGMTSGTPSEPSGPPPANVVRTASIPTLPLPAVPNTPPPVAAPAPAPVATVAPPAPVPAPAPAAPIPPPAATMPPAVAAAVAPPAVDRPSAVAPTPASRRADAAAAAQIHGELSAGPSERFNRRVLPDVPTMLIDLGPDLSSQAEETEEETPARPPQPAVAATVVVPVAAPVPVPAQVAPPPSIAVATPVEPPPPARRLDVHAAEIDTGMRPQPPAALLEAPPGGPSIMIDPRLVAEMDAFELENTAATPPPALTGQPPQAGQRPVAGTMSSPSAGAVVSFVRGGPARPGGAGFNAAPTIEVAPQATAPAAPAPASAAPSAPMPVPASAPTSASAPAPAPASVPAPVSVPAPASPSAPGAGAAVPAPAVSGEIAGARHTPGTRPVPHDRRASGEFDALEAEFFAREKDLYGKEEPVENFDDLDPNHQGNKGNKGKTS